MAAFDYRRDIWKPLLQRVADEDEPWYRCGGWTIEKLYFVGHYLALTTQAMVGNPAFQTINYVDLFCGPGIDVIRGRRNPTRYPGSPLLAAFTPKPFSSISICDAKRELSDACTTRVHAIKNEKTRLYHWSLDANIACDKIVGKIPDRSLTIVFADPYSLGALRFPTIQRLASLGRVDLIILFADRMDLGRNLNAYLTGRSSKLDDFLGSGSQWRDRYRTLDSHEPDKVRAFIANEYCIQLKSLGYEWFRTREIKSEKGPLYRLVYASKHDLGLKFWDIAASYDVDGSRSLWQI